MDRISKLPIGVIESILCLLHTQEAARTSILSREWRYHWITIPKLKFIEEAFKVSTDGDELSVLEQTFNKPSERRQMTKKCKLFYAIYQVLLMHQGPIHEFILRVKADDSCVEIDHIILHLSKKNTVKRLVLDFNGKFTLPLSFFSLHQLTDLYLNGCFIYHQPSESGFGSLTTLYLEKLWISEKALLRFLSSCPSLKTVTLRCCGTTMDVSGDSTIVDLFKCLPLIEYLSIWFDIVLCFDPDKLPKVLPTALVHLKYLCLECVCFKHIFGLPFLVLLIRSSPNLEKLRLEILSEVLVDEDEFGSFTLEDYSDIRLEHLNELEIMHFSKLDVDMDLIKLILAKSPVLKKVKIYLLDELGKDEELQIWKIFFSSPCASPMVKVTMIMWNSN